jgi:hypothetical protein
MSARDDGGPAFSRAGNQWSQDGGELGMSLRDYFAAKAMTAIIATRDPSATVYQIQHEAARAFAYADAMLAERAK